MKKYVKFLMLSSRTVIARVTSLHCSPLESPSHGAFISTHLPVTRSSLPSLRTVGTSVLKIRCKLRYRIDQSVLNS
ncbi:hypothetical protein BDN70DRAFT_480458 [Pholiota conissans]|uniref:Uncharacterized protein n=1 Tax=Pholiota conissans TaxID=109636 RepID=A0A9P5Z8R0_9AGAR|nr:hypothetical protein BDN70DRAFT_480458 [Pholiota conissans]